ncbi:hypothetical protein L6452_44946 [Arctium lappa]|nr:hypothetical protein L6452_44946 [Arctium lappa]
MCKCRSHGTFPLFGLQSSHLNICYYHQDPHRRPLRPGSRPRFCSDRRALLLIGAWHLPRRPGVGRALKRHPFSGLVDSAGMLTLEPFSEDQGRSAVHPTRGIPPISFLAPCGFTHPLTRTHVRLLGPCFKTGRMGCPQAGAGSTQVPRHAVTARAANHDRRDGISTGISTARALAAAPIRTASLQDDTLGSLESASLASARLDTKALTTTTSRASVKGDSFLGQPHHGHGRPVSAPNDTHPHWGGVVGGDAMRDAQADVPSAEWLRAQLAFKNSMVHGILQFTPSFDNDPSAGSPTETLLRLLLPLNDKVQWNSRDVAGGEPPTSPRS